MYKLQQKIGEFPQTILRLSDGAYIPPDPDNTDYQRFKQDLADGAELLDSEGNVMDGLAFIATLH